MKKLNTTLVWPASMLYMAFVNSTLKWQIIRQILGSGNSYNEAVAKFDQDLAYRFGVVSDSLHL
jgi:hypothetical protein